MRAKILAVAALVLTLAFVVANTLILDSMISEIKREVDALGTGADSLDAAEAIYEKFSRYEAYVSITVSHEDLTNIETSFSELIGYLSVGDSDGSAVVKRRLSDALGHLHRLSGINIDAII